MRNEKLIAACWNVLESEGISLDVPFFVELLDSGYRGEDKDPWLALFKAATDNGLRLDTPDGVLVYRAAKFYFVCFILCAEGEM